MNSNAFPADMILPAPDEIPGHIAIIMDGNGRWAKKKLLNRVKGHEVGAGVVRTMVRTCSDLGVSYLTLYAFSTENWNRPKMEITALMMILKNFLKTELQEMLDKNIRFQSIGQIERLPEDVQQRLHETVEKTKNNSGMVLNLALSYGGRAEITEMVKNIALKVRNGKIDPDDIDSDLISNCLYTKGLPDPDLMIRTSGETRISNFLLWQLAYSELFFTNTLWPDFTREELIQIIIEFQGRERRFGKV
ncbi:Isoprenyl transferase [Desulfonema limicola]|uniref:Isoprenyl transferase n=1 Tax=Desulfonema limicola TaxID=45656 RepID=A0A975GJ13_9BACT|nr:isoprenyl transferase [Desulfonema limicola]QTA82498.1 Isoprenyl transferase [Desulfonema limicola]